MDAIRTDDREALLLDLTLGDLETELPAEDTLAKVGTCRGGVYCI